jgi:hypothetical protein
LILEIFSKINEIAFSQEIESRVLELCDKLPESIIDYYFKKTYMHHTMHQQKGKHQVYITKFDCSKSICRYDLIGLMVS